MLKPRRSLTRSCALLLLSLLTTTLAWAHPDHGAQDLSAQAAFFSGLMHPLTGLDHLSAMISVGAWAMLNSSNARQALKAPLLFMSFLTLGALLAGMGINLPEIELMIKLSLLGLAALLWAGKKWPITGGYALIAVFASFHGAAHGSELPMQAFSLSGMLISTAGVHLAGIALAWAFKRQSAHTLGKVGA
jgi:urease accessory protein